MCVLQSLAVTRRSSCRLLSTLTATGFYCIEPACYSVGVAGHRAT